MLPQNRAAALLRRIRKEHAEQSQLALIPLYLAQAVLSLALVALALIGMPAWTYAAALAVGQAVITGLLIWAMTRIDGEIAGALAKAGITRAACPRIVELEVREWRIIGVE